MKRIAIPIITAVTVAGMIAWGPWFFLVGLGLALIGGSIEGWTGR